MKLLEWWRWSVATRWQAFDLYRLGWVRRQLTRLALWFVVLVNKKRSDEYMENTLHKTAARYSHHGFVVLENMFGPKDTMVDGSLYQYRLGRVSCDQITLGLREIADG